MKRREGGRRSTDPSTTCRYGLKASDHDLARPQNRSPAADDSPHEPPQPHPGQRACAPRARAATREPYAVVGRPRNEGHGKRLTAAFEALEVFPALAESRNRLLALIAEERPSTGDVVRAIESDVALVISVHAPRQRARLAQARPGRVGRQRRRGALARGRPARSRPTPRPSSSSSAARRGTPRRSASACTPSPSSAPPTASPPPPATRTATACSSPPCCTTSASSCSCTPTRATRSRSTAPRARPEERLHYERRELGVDHALVGGVLARRWNLPNAVASAIERHHAEDAQGDAAFVRLADMLAHYSQGSPVSSTELLRAARAVGFGPSELRSVLYDLPYPSKDRPRAVEPCPLSVARARGPQAPRPGHGLQADRARALALDQHGAHAPAQHLRQARRGRPRPGRPARHRARLALSQRAHDLYRSVHRRQPAGCGRDALRRLAVGGVGEEPAHGVAGA